MIVRYRCDVAMARSKGILRFCNKKCKDCLCAIRTNEHGEEEHTHDLKHPCGNFTLRNLKVMSGRDHE